MKANSDSTNPTTVMSAVLNRCTNLKVLALCDGVMLPDKKLEMMERVGLPPETGPELRVADGGD